MAYSSFAPLGSQFTTDTSGVFVPEIWAKDLIRHRDEILESEGQHRTAYRSTNREGGTTVAQETK